MKFINTTPHPITLLNPDGTEFTVPPCGVLINATAEETNVVETGRHGEIDPAYRLRPSLHRAAKEGVQFVRTRFVANPLSEAALAQLEAENPDALIIGSLIAAQAFPGRVLAMIAAKGFERVPSDQKKMRADKFTIF